MPLHCYKTNFKDVIDVELGCLRTREIVKVCSKHKYFDDDNHEKRRVRNYGSSELLRLVASGSSHSYQLMVEIGLRRFQKYRQIKEIREELIDEYGLMIPESQIGSLAERFLLYVRCVHEHSVSVLWQEMESQGGWVLHVDSSAEGKELVFVGMGAFQGNQVVLFAQRVGTERSDRLSEVLIQAKKAFSEPLATVRDMGVGGWDAVTDVFPDTPQRVCQWHFLADVGSDMLKRLHDELRGLLRKTNIRKYFQGVRDELAKELVIVPAHVRNYERFLTEEVRTPGQLLWALSTWVIDYRSAGEGLNFPFDLPYWYLYQRLTQAQKAVGDLAKAERDPQIIRRIRRVQGRLDKIFGASDTGNHFQVIAAKMEKVIDLFTRFRTILRLSPGATLKSSVSLTLREEVIRSNKELKEFHDESAKGSDNEEYDEELQRAYKIITDHLDKHGQYLFLPELDKSGKAFPLWAILDRTNNIEESFFGRFKTGIRRASGKKNLSQEFAAHAEHRALAENLKTPAYVRLIYGSLDNLAERFAGVPIEQIRQTARGAKTRKEQLQYLPRRKHIKLNDLLDSISRTLAASDLAIDGPNNRAHDTELVAI